MKQYILLAGLVFGTASGAWAQGVRPQAKARPAVGSEFVVSVSQFGAVADGKIDNADAFQKAVDTLAARIEREVPRAGGHRAKGIVLVPSSAQGYKIGRPIWVDSRGIEIRGEGLGSRVECFPQRNHPLFVFGVRRVPTVKVKDKTERLESSSKYRPDLFGRLDATAAPARGVRGGFRTHGETLIQAQATPLSDGPRHSKGDYTTDHWRETRTLTVEFAVEGPGGGVLPAGTPLFGIGVVTKDVSRPLHVYTDGPNHYVVRFSTQEKRFGPTSPHRFGFSSGKARGIQRLAFQIDLERAEVAAFVDGREVAVEPGLGADFEPGRLHFAENDYFPLLIADSGGDRPALGSAHGKDWTLAGLLFSKTIRYRRQGAGRPQTRADRTGAAINDAYRYFPPFADDPGAIGHFTFDDRPDEAGRMLTIQGGPASGGHKSAAFLMHCLQSLQGGIEDNGLRDLNLVGANLYGQNVAIGQVIDLRISGVRTAGAYHGIGSLSFGANYTVRLDDCTFDATDSGYFALDQILWARNLHFVNAGRVPLRFVGSVVNVENVFVGFPSSNSEGTIKIHAGDYGGNYAFRNVVVDFEGESFAHTPFYAEIHPYAPETSLRLTDVFLGTVGEGVPVITLKDAPPEWRKTGYLSVDVLQAFTKKLGPVVEVDGPGWRGVLRGVKAGDEPAISYRGKEGRTRLKIED